MRREVYSPSSGVLVDFSKPGHRMVLVREEQLSFEKRFEIMRDGSEKQEKHTTMNVAAEEVPER